MPTTSNVRNNFRVTAATICSIVFGFTTFAAEDPRWEFAGDLSERAAFVAENLAIRETSGIVAEAATTEAYTADLAAIYAAYPGLAAATPRVESPNTIIVDLDPDASQDAVLGALPTEAGEVTYRYAYHHWIALDFSRTVHATNLARWVEANVAGVRTAQPDYTLGDGDDVIYHAGEDLYAFKRGDGDCPSGCLGESWRFVLMSASGPVEIGAEELEVVFTGALNTPVLSTLEVAPGDWLALANLAPGSALDVVRENDLGRVLVAGDYLDFGSASSEGTYEITVQRPYGLAPVVHTVDIRLAASNPLFSGERLLDGWVNDADFGWVYDQAGDWKFHAQHGWLYLPEAGRSAGHSWAFDAQVGWMLLDRGAYPWIFGRDHGWMYYQKGTSAPRYFFKSSIAFWWAVK